MSDSALWAARLHLNSGTPATILGTEMIRAICEAYVAADERVFWLEGQDEYGVRVLLERIAALTEQLARVDAETVPRWQHDALCREEALKERAACAAIIQAECEEWTAEHQKHPDSFTIRLACHLERLATAIRGRKP